jgi:hypothetical protein
MQMFVVILFMPSLVLLSRTREYSFFRIGGALFAAIASIGWIAERLLRLHNSVDVAVGGIAWHSIWIAGFLFLISLVCWARHRQTDSSSFLSSSGFRRLPSRDLQDLILVGSWSGSSRTRKSTMRPSS